MAKNIANKDATIAISGTVSDNITVPSGTTLLGIFLPAGMTGTSLSFKAGADASTTPIDIAPANTLYSITVGATAKYYPVVSDHFQGVQYLQVVSGTAEAAARTITLVFGKLE